MRKAFARIMKLLLAIFVASCSNPLNQMTSDRYSQECVEAERNGRLEVAEQACYRALVNVDLGNLGDEQKSQKMYNLARIKRKVGKFDESEKLCKDSLMIEDRLSTSLKERIGRRLAELALLYGDRLRYEEGLPYVERLYPLADLYQASEKKTVSAIFYVYAQELQKQEPTDVTLKLFKKAIEMGFDPKDLTK